MSHICLKLCTSQTSWPRPLAFLAQQLLLRPQEVASLKDALHQAEQRATGLQTAYEQEKGKAEVSTSTQKQRTHTHKPCRHSLTMLVLNGARRGAGRSCCQSL